MLNVWFRGFNLKLRGNNTPSPFQCRSAASRCALTWAYQRTKLASSNNPKWPEFVKSLSRSPEISHKNWTVGHFTEFKYRHLRCYNTFILPMIFLWVLCWPYEITHQIWVCLWYHLISCLPSSPTLAPTRPLRSATFSRRAVIIINSIFVIRQGHELRICSPSRSYVMGTLARRNWSFFLRVH